MSRKFSKLTDDVFLFGFFLIEVESGFSQSLLQRLDSNDGAYLLEFGVAGACHDVPEYFVKASLHFF